MRRMHIAYRTILPAAQTSSKAVHYSIVTNGMTESFSGYHSNT